MNARKGQDIDLLGLPSQAEIEAMKELGLQPGAVGYDPAGRLVRRREDGSLECLPDGRPDSLTVDTDD